MKLKTIFSILLLILAVACSPAGDEPTIPTIIEDPTSEPPLINPGEEIPIKTIEGEATVETISIAILESFPVQVHVNVTGYLGDGCTTLGEISTTPEGNTFFITIPTERPADALCTQQLVGFDENIPLNVLDLPAGTYTVNANGVTDSFTLQIDNIAIEP